LLLTAILAAFLTEDVEAAACVDLHVTMDEQLPEYPGKARDHRPTRALITLMPSCILKQHQGKKCGASARIEFRSRQDFSGSGEQLLFNTGRSEGPE
jgi:phosphoenolpyruvate carboxylase